MGRPDSLLHFTRRILHLRRAYPVLGRGSFALRDASDPAVLAHTRSEEAAPGDEGGSTLICVVNLAAAPRAVSISVPELAGRATRDIFGGTPFPSVGDDGALRLTLGGLGYYWLEVLPPERQDHEDHDERAGARPEHDDETGETR